MAIVDWVKHTLPLKLRDGKRHLFPTLASMVYQNDGKTTLADEQGLLTADRALDSSKLGGKAPSEYLGSSGTAADSYKLGGKAPEYYVQPRNLLDNSDFRRRKNIINQRGLVTYTANGYTIDRWQIWDGALSIGDDYIAVKNAYQLLELDLTKTYTFAARTGDGVVTVTGNFNPATTATLGNLTITMSVLNGYAEVVLTAASGYDVGGVIWAALYEGEYTADTLPPYVPKGYAAELMECMRYYQVIPERRSGVVSQNGFMCIDYIMPVKMRTKPTASKVGNDTVNIDIFGIGAYGAKVDAFDMDEKMYYAMLYVGSGHSGSICTTIEEITLSADL